MEKETFEQQLSSLLNRNSKENASNTPDYLLAEYLSACLENYNSIVKKRDAWFGIDVLERQNSDLKDKKN